jgi:hypothetical protein
VCTGEDFEAGCPPNKKKMKKRGCLDLLNLPFPSQFTTTTLAKTLIATIFWRSRYLAGSIRVVLYSDGAVNTLYNEIIFSNMIHIDLCH